MGPFACGPVPVKSMTSRSPPGSSGGGAGQGDPLGVQAGLVDAVVLGVVLPDPLPHRDLREDLAAVGLGRRVHGRVEAGLDRVDAVPVEQLAEPARPHQAGRALGVEVGRERVGHPRVARHDRQCRLIRDALVPQPDRRHHQALLEHRGRGRRHRAGHRSPDVVVVAERLHERDHLGRVCALAGREHRHRHAQVGQVPDAALAAVHVVVEEHVARAHRLQREVARDGVHQRRVRAAGELAQVPVVDAGAEVVRVADHRRARRPGDRGLDLHLDAGQVPRDDLDQHRVGRRAVDRRQAVRLPRPRGHLRVAHDATPVRVSSTLPKPSTSARNPGCTGMVEPNSSITAGPSTTSPAPSSARS